MSNLDPNSTRINGHNPIRTFLESLQTQHKSVERCWNNAKRSRSPEEDVVKRWNATKKRLQRQEQVLRHLRAAAMGTTHSLPLHVGNRWIEYISTLANLHAEMLRGAESLSAQACRVIASKKDDLLPRPRPEHRYQERQRFKVRTRAFNSMCEAYSQQIADALVEWAGLEDHMVHAVKNHARPPVDMDDGPLEIRGTTVLVCGKVESLNMTVNRMKDVIAFLTAVIAAGGNWINSAEIDKQQPISRGTRWDRIYRALPKRIKQHIESGRSKGFRLIVA